MGKSVMKVLLAHSTCYEFRCDRLVLMVEHDPIISVRTSEDLIFYFYLTCHNPDRVKLNPIDVDRFVGVI